MQRHWQYALQLGYRVIERPAIHASLVQPGRSRPPYRQSAGCGGAIGHSAVCLSGFRHSFSSFNCTLIAIEVKHTSTRPCMICLRTHPITVAGESVLCVYISSEYTICEEVYPIRTLRKPRYPSQTHRRRVSGSSIRRTKYQSQ